MNWVDLVIVIFMVVCLVRGFQIGLIGSLFNLVIGLGSVVGSFFLYRPLTSLLETQFGVPSYIAPAAAFGVFLLLIHVVMHWIASLAWVVVDRVLKALVPLYYLDRALGVVLQGGFGLVVALVLIVLMFRLPIDPNLKQDLQDSYLVQNSLPVTGQVEGYLRQLVGKLPTDTLLYLIPKQPQNDETVPMRFPERLELRVDEDSERRMLELVNKERSDRGLRELLWDDSIVPTAREHSRDMFVRSYFSHTNPDGESHAQRMDEDGVEYLLSGENLAYAPTVEIAHQGLMNSPGHRANILREEFGRVGIGVIDGGLYGMMFTQNFAD